MTSIRPSSTKEPDLYEYLRKECPDIDSAKVWMRKWLNEWDQKLPWEKTAVYTQRAMAGHLSNVLEGGNYETGYATGRIAYCETKYGTELYYIDCPIATNP